MKKTKVGLVGVGKRIKVFHYEILKKLEFDLCGCTSKTEKSGKLFEKEFNVNYFNSIKTLIENTKPDFVICAVPQEELASVLEEVVSYNIPAIIETPVSDPEIIKISQKANVPICVLEQWPFLPIELFKQAVFEKGLISRPFLVKNDGRSFNYHAIAQLKGYLTPSLPISAYGMNIGLETPEFLDQSGKLKKEPELWDIGNVRFENGTVLTHEFSYHCKTAPFRPMQTLRSYSDNGTIVTGKNGPLGDDYDILDFKYLSGKETKVMNVIVERVHKDIAPSKIIDKESGVMWENKFKDLDFSDQQSACAHLFSLMQDVIDGKIESKNLYTCELAYFDSLLMYAIQHSARNGSNTVSLSGKRQ